MPPQRRCDEALAHDDTSFGATDPSSAPPIRRFGNRSAADAEGESGHPESMMWRMLNVHVLNGLRFVPSRYYSADSLAGENWIKINGNR